MYHYVFLRVSCRVTHDLFCAGICFPETKPNMPQKLFSAERTANSSTQPQQQSTSTDYFRAELWIRLY